MIEENEQEEEAVLEAVAQNITWRIPECCREGWDSCPHVIQREDRKKRQNPGL